MINTENNAEIKLSSAERRRVTLCNHNYSIEGVYHPDRIMDEYDLLYMQAGEWDIVEDDRTFHIGPGKVLCLEPGRHHYSLGKCSPNMRNVYIHFSALDGDVLSFSDLKSEKVNATNTAISASVSSSDIEAMLTANADAEDKINTNYFHIGKLTDVSDNHEVLHLFEKVIDAFWADENAMPDKNLRCSVYLEELLMELADEYKAVQGSADILVEEIIHRFHCHSDRFMSPEELADSYNVSIRTISGRFKKATGISIHQYQLGLKLDIIYDLLPTCPGRSLHDIATSFGFYDEFQMSRLFKKRFGISPSKRK